MSGSESGGPLEAGDPDAVAEPGTARESHHEPEAAPDPVREVPLPRRPMATGMARVLLLSGGWLFALLALLGALLPVVPATPFLLLAAACFARSSPSIHRRLLANRAFGPYLEQWQREGTVPPEAKLKAYGLVVLSFGVSIYFVPVGWLRLLLGCIAAGLLLFLIGLPTTRGPREGD